MLPALTAWFRGGRRGRAAAATNAAQLTLALDEAPPPRTADELLARLIALGLRDVTACRLTTNRTVLVSWRHGVLRVHAAFLEAPRAMLRAIATFVSGRTRAERHAARAAIVAYPIPASFARPRRRLVTAPNDAPLVARLVAMHGELNARWFGGTLGPVSIVVSRRMRARLGHYAVSAPDSPAQIAISRRHLRRHGWADAGETLLHELVHQWQDETGQPVDHGAAFKRKAREVGIPPRAARVVG